MDRQTDTSHGHSRYRASSASHDKSPALCGRSSSQGGNIGGVAFRQLLPVPRTAHTLRSPITHYLTLSSGRATACTRPHVISSAAMTFKAHLSQTLRLLATDLVDGKVMQSVPSVCLLVRLFPLLFFEPYDL